jgi:hypothetical protein
MAQALIEDLHRDARLAQTGADRRSDDHQGAKRLASPITIRNGTVDDAGAVRRVADLGSAEVPTAPLLLAEVHGEVRAAMSLIDGAVVADPFHYTATIIELLEACASYERADRRSRLRRRFGRVLHWAARRADGRVASRPAEV